MKKIAILALVFAILTGFLGMQYLSSLENRTKMQYETVLTAAADIEPYTVIDESMVAETRVPEGTAHALAARKAEEVVGRVTESRLLAGEQLFAQKLQQPGDGTGGLSYLIPAGMRAVTVPVDEVTGVGGFPRKNDFVDVLGIITVQGTEKSEPYSLMVADAVQVLATGTSLNRSAEAGLPQSVTLIVTPTQGERIAYALSEGKVRLTLHGANDGTKSKTSPITAADLLKTN